MRQDCIPSYDNKAQVGLFCGQEIENISSCTPSRSSSEDTTSSLVLSGIVRFGSPLGEEMTKMGITCFGREKLYRLAVNIPYHHSFFFTLPRKGGPPYDATDGCPKCKG
ncbi:hypothetical protein TanjilG_06441 [Lupinus angustifolius]|uniref:Uncharacterized protein n=1 Tax=Lupinus angustifolius TaxID=3871 RepID=A0A1J7ITI7_LUPAN|nr:hypothetical protein TanjilG_06441 [Lupinus angustifolius]